MKRCGVDPLCQLVLDMWEVGGVLFTTGNFSRELENSPRIGLTEIFQKVGRSKKFMHRRARIQETASNGYSN